MASTLYLSKTSGYIPEISSITKTGYKKENNVLLPNKCSTRQRSYNMREYLWNDKFKNLEHTVQKLENNEDKYPPQ